MPSDPLSHQDAPRASQPHRTPPAPLDAGLVHVEAPILQALPGGWFQPGNGRIEHFQDFEDGPRMVVVPRGSFMMGSTAEEPRWRGYDGREEPRHQVDIPREFAVGATPVTRREFAAFVAATGHRIEDGAFAWLGKRWWMLNLDKTWRVDLSRSWRDPGYFQTQSHPVVAVSWETAQVYCAWLSSVTSHRYRLLSEAEWEYCCRAGTSTPYSTGAGITHEQAHFAFESRCTSPVMRFPPNSWGLYDMHGNVWEWVEDDWHPDYSGDPPTDGSPWRNGDPELRGLRGGDWDFGNMHFRSADRGRGPKTLRNYIVGFRVAREI